MLLLAPAASVTHGTAVTSRDSSPHIQCGGNLRCSGTNQVRWWVHVCVITDKLRLRMAPGPSLDASLNARAQTDTKQNRTQTHAKTTHAQTSLRVHTSAHTHTVKQTRADETLGHPADHPDQCVSRVFSDLICLANIHLFSPINNTEQHVFMTLLLLTQFICSSSKLKHCFTL